MSNSTASSTSNVASLQTCARLIDLTRPLALLDLETTGVSPEEDRIIQVGIARITPGGDVETYSQLVNPGRPVPQDVQDLTGITEDQLEDAPPFCDVAPEVNQRLGDADLSGYNVEDFDLPFLTCAFERIGLPLEAPPQRCVIDVYEIFRKKEPHSLERAVLHYTGRPPETSHQALSDVLATGEVLASQLARYGFSGTPEEIAAEVRHPHIDADGKLKRDGEQILLCFGKYEGWAIEDVEATDPGYLDWIVREIGGTVGDTVADRRAELEASPLSPTDDLPF